MKKHASETALLPDLAFVIYFECFLAKSFESEHEIEKKILFIKIQSKYHHPYKLFFLNQNYL